MEEIDETQSIFGGNMNFRVTNNYCSTQWVKEANPNNGV
jgi:hypothetical protein